MNKKNITSGEGKKKNAVGNIFTKILEKNNQHFLSHLETSLHKPQSKN